MKNREADFSDQMRERYREDLFPQFLGIKLEEVRAGYARVSMEIKPEMHNFNSVTHGGAVFTLADTAFGLSSNTRGTALALQISINYVRASVCGERLIAEAEEEHLTKSTGVYRITVYRDKEMLALMRGTVFRKNK
jgi:acyl-CoA thioesterase